MLKKWTQAIGLTSALYVLLWISSLQPQSTTAINPLPKLPMQVGFLSFLSEITGS